MHRFAIAAGCAGITLLGAACGSSAAGAGASSTQSAASSTDSGAGRGGGGTRGELVKLDATTLVLNTTGGDVTVSYTSTTTVLKTSTAALADIQPGMCITASGRRDAAGTLTITAVSLTDALNGSCAGGPGGAFGRGPAAGTAPSSSATPDPSRSPRPNAGNFAGVRGLVKAVDGTSVTVTPIPFTPPGASTSSSSTTSLADQTITVPTTVTVSRTAQGSTSDLAVGDCVAATGQKDATTGVVAARALSIQPAGPTGCFTGGRGGGFGGGGFGGGGGGGGAGGGSATSVGG